MRISYWSSDVCSSDLHGHHIERSADLDAFPEGDAILDRRRRLLGIGIIPGGVAVHLPAHGDMMIMGDAFPRAQARRRSLRPHAGIDRSAWEIMIALDNDRYAAVGDHPAVPPSLHHHTHLSPNTSSTCSSPRPHTPHSD